MFRDGVLWEGFRRRFYYRFLKPPGHWHNREYSSRQTITRTGDGGFLVRWTGHGEVHARSLAHLQPVGDSAAIVASGPSVHELDNPAQLFHSPTACVNGSVSLPAGLKVRAAYYVVSDSNFIEQQPHLFQQGVEMADAIILNPKTVLTAMLLLPGVLDNRPVFLREDMRYPFKGPRLGGRRVMYDPRVLAHPSGDRAYSMNPAEGTYPGGTVAYDAVQVLFGLGYRRLYLFGMDLTTGGRFYREGVPSPSRLDRAFHTKIIPSFELVRTYCRQTGKQLFNCAPDSRLPASIIPKLDPNEALRQLSGGPRHLTAA